MMFIENHGNNVGGRAIFSPGAWVDLIDALYDSIGLHVLDFNGDGDGDVQVDTTHRYSIYTDGSFLKHGYANNSTLVGVEQLADRDEADFDADGDIDGVDFLTWQRHRGGTGNQSSEMPIATA